MANHVKASIATILNAFVIAIFLTLLSVVFMEFIVSYFEVIDPNAVRVER